MVPKITSYTEKVLDHFQNPRNLGEMKNPDIEATVGNPSCGDVLKLYLKLKENPKDKTNPKIEDIKFQTYGCAAAIATSSMTTVLAKGKTLKEAKKITPQDVAKSLGQLPPIKVHCSNLAADALKKAISDWEKKQK
ncbi:MAG: iron-sulfur cluster assembly scaffold protein [archaeon]